MDIEDIDYDEIIRRLEEDHEFEERYQSLILRFNYEDDRYGYGYGDSEMINYGDMNDGDNLKYVDNNDAVDEL